LLVVFVRLTQLQPTINNLQPAAATLRQRTISVRRTNTEVTYLASSGDRSTIGIVAAGPMGPQAGLLRARTRYTGNEVFQRRGFWSGRIDLKLVLCKSDSKGNNGDNTSDLPTTLAEAMGEE
jgi:hypothetical protein